MKHKSVLENRPAGLYCPAGDFYIDPLRGVDQAVITHAHGDHARAGSGHYHASPTCVPLLRKRYAIAEDKLSAHNWSETFQLGGATVSLHPAGHILGSAQVRIEVDGEVWVVSGDYKREPDVSCEAFEVVPCDVFITEATFALPVYQWRPSAEVLDEIAAWMEANRKRGENSVLQAYSLGKAQRLLAGLKDRWQGTAWIHGSIEGMTDAYREAGIPMLPTRHAKHWDKKAPPPPGQLILAPPSTAGSDSVWLKRFEPCQVASVSGWATIRGVRRRRGDNQGFPLSDHADWPGLLQTVRETGAKKVWVTHGQCELFARYLSEVEKIDALALANLYGGDEAEETQDSE